MVQWREDAGARRRRSGVHKARVHSLVQGFLVELTTRCRPRGCVRLGQARESGYARACTQAWKIEDAQKLPEAEGNGVLLECRMQELDCLNRAEGWGCKPRA